MNMLALENLPEPEFIERDAAKVLRECIEFVELALDRPLEPEQFERVMVDLIVYREMVLREQFNEASKQNLVAFARYPMIDHLMGLIGNARLSAAPAHAPLMFVFSAPLGAPLPIAAGFRVRSKDARVTFVTGDAVVVGIGATTITLTGTCTVAGGVGNNYAPGQISEPLDALGVAFTVSNTATTEGGVASETTEAMRPRFPLAIRALSVAGPFSAYEDLARRASSEVKDVWVMSPEPLLMRIYVLGVDGEASPELLETVVDALDPIERRPALDEVEAVSAEATEWSIEIGLVLRADRVGVAETAADLALALERAEAYAAELASKIKAPPIRNELITRVKHAGVYDLTVTEPAANVVLDDGEWADCVAIAVSVVGYQEST